MIDLINGTSTCQTTATSTTECYYEFVPVYETATNSTTTLTQYQQADIFLSFLLFVTVCTIAIAFAIVSLYTKRTYLQYGGGDVEMRKDL